MKRLCIIFTLFLSSLVSGAMGVYIPDELGGRFTLTQEMVDAAKGRFVVMANYDLEGQTVVLPEKMVLDFRGGSINGGTLVGKNSSVKVATKKPAFGLDMKIEGSWNQPEVHDGWFEFDPSETYVSNGIISNMLAFADDEHKNHILFEEDRVYHFELPYKDRADIGNMVSYRMVDGEKKRRYSDIYKDEFSFLRIFTIPSNTRLTVNNTWKMNPTNVGAYFIFWEHDKENITVDGNGAIHADNLEHLYNAPYAGKYFYGEWGFIFRCIQCRNFTFRDITLADAFGDCIIFSGSYRKGDREPRYSDGLVMDNVKILRARRNGVAVGARNVRISNCYFEGCGTSKVKGTNPQSAIDLEPDGLSYYSEIGNENVLVDKCVFVDNEYDIHSYKNNLDDYGKMASVVSNCKFTGSLIIKGTYWLRFVNCDIQRLTRRETDLMWQSGSNHVEFVNCNIGEISDEVLHFPSKKKNLFKDCKYKLQEKK